MATGKVKWFNDSKGYGFIKPDDGSESNGADIYVHISALEKAGKRTLKDNQLISYNLERTKDGLWAIDLELLE